MLYSFPPNDFSEIERGYQEFAERLGPILDVFDAEGVRFALEVHPTEIAYDFVTTRKALDALGRRASFGINFDPSHFIPQLLDPAPFVAEFADRIYHVHVKDSHGLDGRRSILGSHLDFGEEERGWDFVSPGHGDVDFEAADPGAEPHRLRRAALDRVGGRRHGPRVGRPGCAALRARQIDFATSRRFDARCRPSTAGVRRRRAHDRVPTIGVGMLGYAFMGRAHTNALRTLAYMTWPPPADARLVSIAGRNAGARSGGGRPLRLRARGHRLARARRGPGSSCSTTSAQTACTPSPRSRRREAGKHVICEKPLARSADEAYDVWRAVAATGVKHLCAFNYRFVPAVRLARQIIESGELGEIHHFRGRYLQDWLHRPGCTGDLAPRPRRARARARSATSART